MTSISIIGGGAAGLMAAAMAKEENPQAEVRLFEKNTILGNKILISGGGRCNVTTGITNVKDILQNYPRGAKFLMTAMFHFPPESVMDWFINRGVPLKTEKDLRVFPVSDNGHDIVGALENELKTGGVEIFLKTPIEEIKKVGQQFQLKTPDGREFLSDKVIITTGGNAYRHTGSTGDGYAFAKALGHTLTTLGPSLSSFLSLETWVGKVAGVSFPHAKLTLSNDDKTFSRERTGPFVFTHKGVSGPAVFVLSSFAAFETLSAATPHTLTIDFFPGESFEGFDEQLRVLLEKNSRKSLHNTLDIILPKSLCALVVELLGFDEKPTGAYLTRALRHRLGKFLKAFPLTIVGRGSGDEFVTAGGVELGEVDSRTMESKLCKGLFFAGEILDIDGFTGGFNLQASWATGALAGKSAA